MSFRPLVASLVFASAACSSPSHTTPVVSAPPDAAAPPPVDDHRDPHEAHFTALRQLTDGGENAEAYWAWGGDKLIFQTTQGGRACDAIMTMPALAASKPTPTLLSTGSGRTTCSYYFPGDHEILYASTHETLGADCPPPPDRSQGYVWALYDYDIYKANADGSGLRKLFGAPGAYDAEATICQKDGSIIFTSNKDGDLDLYRMDADGGNVTRVTNTPGYDGGAFFSADCSQIVWRASRPTGADLDDYKALLQQKLVRPTKLEIWVADADGSDPHQVTYLDAASFAPYFHPSGKRIVFASNYGDPQGREFDIWAVDTDGTDLERITYTPGFDGFPMFSPDGKHLSFSSNRASPPPAPGSHNQDTNVFVADWIDDVPRTGTPPEPSSADRAQASIDYLADDAREGRGVGTQGLADAIEWVEAQLKSYGVEPGMPDGTYRMPFEVTTGLERGAGTSLEVDGAAVDAKELAPSQVSASAAVEGKTVYVGYGISDKGAKTDDYRGKAVKGKIVVVRRFAPSGLKAELRGTLSDLNYKAGVARRHGALGMIVVDLPEGKGREAPLPELGRRDGADAGIPVVVATTVPGNVLVKGTHTVKLAVELHATTATTSNVVGVVRAGSAHKQDGVVVVGAHLDHLGHGGIDIGALDSSSDVHNGADDNASGVAALLEVARALAARKGELDRDVYLVAFSGEEMGILGSTYLVGHPPYAGTPVAMLNMDMVGRLRDNEVQVLGAESAAEWSELVTPLCDAARLRCHLAGSGYGPSDHMSFYQGGSPVVHFFTGGHLDYHRATDDADKINAAGIAQIAQVVGNLAVKVAAGPALTYRKVPPPPKVGDIPMAGASLGTIPTYGDTSNIPGVLLSDVVPGGAAQKAGLRKGDRITKIGVTDVRNVEDLMLVLGQGAPGQEVVILFLRDGKPQSVKAVFGPPHARH